MMSSLSLEGKYTWFGECESSFSILEIHKCPPTCLVIKKTDNCHSVNFGKFLYSQLLVLLTLQHVNGYNVNNNSIRNKTFFLKIQGTTDMPSTQLLGD